MHLCVHGRLYMYRVQTRLITETPEKLVQQRQRRQWATEINHYFHCPRSIRNRKRPMRWGIPFRRQRGRAAGFKWDPDCVCNHFSSRTLCIQMWEMCSTQRFPWTAPSNRGNVWWVRAAVRDLPVHPYLLSLPVTSLLHPTRPIHPHRPCV